MRNASLPSCLILLCVGTIGRSAAALDRECISTLQSRMPKVALMFVGAMSAEHAVLWDEWLAPIGDKAPASVLCNEGAHACYREWRHHNSGTSAYERQVLFSFVFDASPSATPEAGALQGAIFTNNGQGAQEADSNAAISIAAVRRLVKAALQDPLNQRFQLITSTTLPIRPPSFVHSQLLAKQTSHFDDLEKVTPEASFQRYRSSQHMYNMHEWSQIRDSLHFSALQFMLVREHAQWISTDRRYIHLLTRSCLGKGDADCASAGNYVSSLVSWRQSGTDLGARQVAQDKHVVELAPARSGTGFGELLQEAKGFWGSIGRLDGLGRRRTLATLAEQPNLAVPQCQAPAEPQIPLEDPQDFKCSVRDPKADELPWSHITYYSSCPLFATPSGAESGSPQDLHHIVDKALEGSLMAQ